MCTAAWGLRVLLVGAAHFSLQITSQARILRLGAEAGDQYDLDEVRGESESAHFGLLAEDIGLIDVHVFVHDRLNDRDQVVKSILCDKVYQPARFEIFE